KGKCRRFFVPYLTSFLQMIILFSIPGLLLLTANKVWLLSAAEKSGKSGAKPGEMLIKLRIRFYQVQCGRFSVRA
ncbi:MAG: hypothetical protein ABN478_09835, partial [Mixta sp.]